jgi:hypothetical protein
MRQWRVGFHEAGAIVVTVKAPCFVTVTSSDACVSFADVAFAM